MGSPWGGGGKGGGRGIGRSTTDIIIILLVWDSVEGNNAGCAEKNYILGACLLVACAE